MKGNEYLQLYYKIYDYRQWKEFLDSRLKIDYFEEIIEEEIPEVAYLDFIDKLQDVFSLDKLEDLCKSMFMVV
jgi:hypothetical protein